MDRKIEVGLAKSSEFTKSEISHWEQFAAYHGLVLFWFGAKDSWALGYTETGDFPIKMWFRLSKKLGKVTLTVMEQPTSIANPIAGTPVTEKFVNRWMEVAKATKE